MKRWSVGMILLVVLAIALGFGQSLIEERAIILPEEHIEDALEIEEILPGEEIGPLPEDDELLEKKKLGEDLLPLVEESDKGDETIQPGEEDDEDEPEMGNPPANESEEGDGFQLGLSFPPTSDEQKRALSKIYLDGLGVKHIRTGTDAIPHYKPLETTPTWGSIEKITWAHQNDYSLMLTIRAYFPSWLCDPTKANERGCLPSDMDQWREFMQGYLAHLLEQHGQLPDKIQFANEWAKKEWFNGTKEDFVTMMNVVYDEVKAVSPETTVVLGGLARGQTGQVAFCHGQVPDFYQGVDPQTFCSTPKYQEMEEMILYVFQNARYDMIDQHLYYDVEKWPGYMAALRSVIIPPQSQDIPIIISEFGGPHYLDEPHDEVYHADRVRMYIETILLLDVEEAYYFKLVEGDTTNPTSFSVLSGLLDFVKVVAGDPNPQKLAYWVFQDYVSKLDT